MMALLRMSASKPKCGSAFRQVIDAVETDVFQGLGDGLSDRTDRDDETHSVYFAAQRPAGAAPGRIAARHVFLMPFDEILRVGPTCAGCERGWRFPPAPPGCGQTVGSATSGISTGWQGHLLRFSG
jgi:hypothetical protein